MSLEDLNRKLYDPNSEVEKITHKETPFDPRLAAGTKASDFQRKEAGVMEEKGLKPGTRKAIKIGIWAIGVIILLGLGTFAIVKLRQSAFSEAKISVTIEGPANIDSNQAARYSIRYRNDNRVSLKNTTILLSYPENFQPEAATNLQVLSSGSSKIYVGDIKAHSEGEIALQGKFYAPEEYLVYLRATLEYTPFHLSSAFQAQTQLGVSVRTSPILLEIAAPLEAASGNNVEYLISYKNLSSRNFSDVRLRADYPEGFEFSSANPLPSESNNFWYLGNLDSDQKGEIKIHGVIRGSSGEGKTFKAYAGSAGSNGKFVVYTQGEKLTKIVSPPLVISQSVNELLSNSVNVGEKLNYVLKYKNTSDIGLRDVIVSLEIESPVLDFSKMNLDNGSYSSAKHMITWKASDLASLANLAPGAEGEIKFSIPVLERIPVKTKNDKNFVIVTRATIDSPDIPTPVGSNKIISSDTLELKLNSKVVLEAFGYHKDLEIKNFGPLPPRVGQETSYVLQWRITNVSNDIADARITSSLPSSVKWIGKIYPESEYVTYNERTNEIVWEVGKLESATGILTPKREVNFQVSITPQVNQVGREALLLNPSILTAKDLFTGEEVRVETRKKSTMLPEDSTVGGDYSVEK